jgi:hypothetical protein
VVPAALCAGLRMEGRIRNARVQTSVFIQPPEFYVFVFK